MLRTMLNLLSALCCLQLCVAADWQSSPVQAIKEDFTRYSAHGFTSEEAAIYTKQMLHGVQLGLMRWSVANTRGLAKSADYRENGVGGLFPDSMTQLVRNNYLATGFYPNAYSAISGDEFNALDVPFGWSSSAPGNFTYLKHYDAAGRVDDHILVAYGASADAGRDANGDGVQDGVIITLETTNWQYFPDTPAVVTREFWTDQGQKVMFVQHKRPPAP